MESTRININLPCDYVIDDKYHCLTIAKEYEDICGGCGIFAQGETLEEAEKDLLRMICTVNKDNHERVNELEKYEWFRLGPWGHIGGHWFTILGIQVYFRYEKKVRMQGGWYIPFTKLNISITNYWRQEWRKRKKIE